MIKPGEIQKTATQAGVRDQQIEKDYVLAWMLSGIAQHKYLSHVLAFKGGTVLKQIYFENYRFSEDLDFTLINESIANDEIMKWFHDIFQFLIEEINLPLEILDGGKYNEDGLHFYITYMGPLGGRAKHKKVKVDISKNEKLEFEPIPRHLLHSYSDQIGCTVLCYSLDEVLIEKMRSVIQRMQARDLYDIWYLLEIHGMDIMKYVNEFSQKCCQKDIDPAIFPTRLKQRLPAYQGRWEHSLKDQIRDLPEFRQVERAVLRHIRKFEKHL